MFLARELDGAGVRLDAELKTAPKISCAVRDMKGKPNSIFPFRCCLACREARGVYLAAIEPQQIYEIAEAYLTLCCAEFSKRGSRRAREVHARQCLRGFASTTDLRANDSPWPQSAFTDRTSCMVNQSHRTVTLQSQDSELLRRDAYEIAEDPPSIADGSGQISSETTIWASRS